MAADSALKSDQPKAHNPHHLLSPDAGALAASPEPRAKLQAPSSNSQTIPHDELRKLDDKHDRRRAPPYGADAILLGRLSSYIIGKELHRAADEGAVYLARNRSGEKCIVKSIRGHWRLRNEADVKLDNVFVNHGQGDQRFSDIQLGDCGGVVSRRSGLAREGHVIGAAFTRSPEATFQLPWGTATDIWSFGTAMLSLVFGGGYLLFNPRIDKVEPGSDEYEFTVLKRMHRFFGPFPQSYQDFKDEDTMTIINFINAQGPPVKPFHRVGPRGVSPADMEFLLKVVKLDPRDRPTAEELLADVWFMEDSQDTRDPLPGDPLLGKARKHTLQP
ncbi:kinase-like domain-containing protein [Lasiosphaeris hirsuta]|uniref:non-specific serine/threonine protein kinase n=1 Tax=Lasiosphaeris hirsuta TaxID=260670 RepID=A0AA40E231_9PEZI|nr:kinase-like domain-containing protein [Lasiosphaeris hirsuta]